MENLLTDFRTAIKLRNGMLMKELFSLQGKVAIITGGNGGIGKGIARGFAQTGSEIVIAARNQEKTKTAVKEIIGEFI